MKIGEDTVKEILRLARSVKFGELVIKIQDAHIVSIEKREKIRLTNTADPAEREAHNQIACHAD